MTNLPLWRDRPAGLKARSASRDSLSSRRQAAQPDDLHPLKVMCLHQGRSKGHIERATGVSNRLPGSSGQCDSGFCWYFDFWHWQGCGNGVLPSATCVSLSRVTPPTNVCVSVVRVCGWWWWWDWSEVFIVTVSLIRYYVMDWLKIKNNALCIC